MPVIGGVIATTADQPPDLGERIVVPQDTATTPAPETTPASPGRTTRPTQRETGGSEVPPPTPPGSDDDDDAGDPGDPGDDGDDDGLDD
ncbi:hypothetical protein [Flindersiella endophytica]